MATNQSNLSITTAKPITLANAVVSLGRTLYGVIAAPFSFIFNLFHRDPVFWPDRCAAPTTGLLFIFHSLFFFLDVKQIQQPKTGIVYNAQSELLFVLFCFSCIISSSRLDGKEFFCSFLAIEIVQKGGLDMCQPAPSRLEI